MPLEKNIYADGTIIPRIVCGRYYITANGDVDNPRLISGPFGAWWEAEAFRRRGRDWMMRRRSVRGRRFWQIEMQPADDY